MRLINYQTFPFSWLADEKVPVQSTNIPYHLEQMLDILKHEEDDPSSGGTTVNFRPEI